MLILRWKHNSRSLTTHSAASVKLEVHVTFRWLRQSIFLMTIFLTASVFGQPWQEQFIETESIIERGESDSAATKLEHAVSLAENRYGRSDSTIDIGFFADGVSYRLYYASFAQADSLYTRAASLAEKALSQNDPKLLPYLRKLGAVYQTLGRYREAEAVFRRALSAAEAAFGPESKETIEVLNDLSDVLCTLAGYGQADSLARKALRLGEALLGPDHCSLARSLDIIGEGLCAREAEDEAEPLCARSLAIREEQLGPEHPDVAKSLCLMGNCLIKMRQTSEADAALTRSLEVRRVALGPEHPETALSLLSLAINARQRLDLSCERLANSSLSILEKTYGSDHPETARAAVYLATTELIQQTWEKYEAAGEKVQQALPTIERALGPNHPLVAFACGLIASSKSSLGRSMEAVAWRERQLAILTEYGYKNRNASMALITLHEGYIRMGMQAQADSALEKAYAIAKDAGGSRFAGEIWHDIGCSLWYARRPAQALACFDKALAILDETSPDDIGRKIYILSSMTISYAETGDFKRAEDLATQVQSMSEDFFGAESVWHGSILHRICSNYILQGRFSFVEQPLLQCLRIYERSLGLHHLRTGGVTWDLATMYAVLGRYDESLDYFRRWLTARHRLLHAVFGASSESQKTYCVYEYPPIIDDILSLPLIYQTKGSYELAMEMILRGKAMVQEVSMGERQAAFCTTDNTVRGQLGLLEEICTAVANHTLFERADADSLETLYSLHDSLETELSRRCTAFREVLELHKVEVADVAACVPEEAALLEFVTYQPVEFDSCYFTFFWNRSHDTESSDDIHFMALVLDAAGEISLYDVGPAEPIDSLVLLARDLIYDAQGLMHSTRAGVAEQKLNEVTGRLRELVFDPLLPQLDGKTNLYISPDGILNLLPFEILPMPDSSYLIEKYSVSYLSSGRDLLRYRQPTETSADVIIMADPDFDNAAPLTIEASSVLTTAGVHVSDTLIHQLRGSEGCLEGPFGRLGHGLTEGKHVAESFRNLSKRSVAEFYGPQASEARLKGVVAGPGVLHLATHGYFCPKAEDLPTGYENPLLRSGLLLAGCNRNIARDTATVTGEDGILTAFEVSGLNLNGTELVTLSACESGMSESGLTGDGFYGLRRAFQHSGAQSVVMSLWRVPDRETRLLMESFYERWLAGSSKRDALRESALKLLRDSREKLGCGHPLLWGGFVLTGNPN